MRKHRRNKYAGPLAATMLHQKIIQVMHRAMSRALGEMVARAYARALSI
jgi:hypothetical protein